ncbi:hypothetical protein [Arthrobacter cupressi]
MASKRRKSIRATAGGAAGCGPFGIFLFFGLIWLLVQYWWVLVIAGVVVALIVALVKSARTPRPLATPRPPAPVQAPEPKPVRKPKPARTPEPIPLAGDELAAHMRALKHASRVRAMQDWDYEWILLAFPGKSSREISEIANAHFARGRSIGVNYGDPSVPSFKTPKPGQRSP